MRVLVTRPILDAAATAEHLTALGHTPLVAPLLEVLFLDGDPVSFEGVQAVLATSVNGVRALVRRTTRRDVTLFAVGRQTSAAARDAGFGGVISADGDSMALAETVRRSADPKAGAVLHVAGAEAEGKLVEVLSGSGFDARQIVLYRTAAVSALPREASDALNHDALDAVLNFSARSAGVFRNCVTNEGLERRCARMLAACISKATAAALEPLRFRELRVAAAPNQDALLACLG